MPTHLFWGDDLAALDRAIENLVEATIDPSWSTLNLSRFDGMDEGESINGLTEARTAPFGSGGRVILIKRSNFCNGCSSEMTKVFETTLDLIPEETHLILSNVNKPDSRMRTTKFLQKMIKSKKAFERKFVLPAVWDQLGQEELVKRTAKEIGVDLDTDGISILVDRIGNDSAKLSSELKKISLLSKKVKGSKQENFASKELIESLIKGKATNSLEIANCLLKQDSGEALSLINILINDGEPALRILATLSNQVRGWLWVNLLEKQGERDVSKIAKSAGIGNPKRIYVIRKQIQGVPTERFLNLLHGLLDVEAAIKKGVMPGDAFKDGLIRDKLFK